MPIINLAENNHTGDAVFEVIIKAHYSNLPTINSTRKLYSERQTLASILGFYVHFKASKCVIYVWKNQTTKSKNLLIINKVLWDKKSSSCNVSSLK